jgi:hypothetical protein
MTGKWSMSESRPLLDFELVECMQGMLPAIGILWKVIGTCTSGWGWNSTATVSSSWTTSASPLHHNFDHFALFNISTSAVWPGEHEYNKIYVIRQELNEFWAFYGLNQQLSNFRKKFWPRPKFRKWL